MQMETGSFDVFVCIYLAVILLREMNQNSIKSFEGSKFNREILLSDDCLGMCMNIVMTFAVKKRNVYGSLVHNVSLLLFFYT